MRWTNLERFRGLVEPLLINSDADSRGKLGVDSSSLQLLKREAAPQAHLRIVLNCRTVHGGTQETPTWPRGGGRAFCSALQAAGLLLCGLIEPRDHLQWAARGTCDAAGPLLVEVLIGHDIIVLHHAYTITFLWR